jgi:hypothetical protein
LVVEDLRVTSGWSGRGSEDTEPEERRRQEDHNWEALKLFFEFFKHFLTLITAIALVVVTLQRALGLGTGATIAVLVVLAINLALCLVGMYVVMWRTREWEISPAPGSLPFFLMAATILVFVAGLFGILGLAVGH